MGKDMWNETETGIEAASRLNGEVVDLRAGMAKLRRLVDAAQASNVVLGDQLAEHNRVANETIAACKAQLAAVTARAERAEALYAASLEHLADWDRRVGELQDELAALRSVLSDADFIADAIQGADLQPQDADIQERWRADALTCAARVAQAIASRASSSAATPAAPQKETSR